MVEQGTHLLPTVKYYRNVGELESGHNMEILNIRMKSVNSSHPEARHQYRKNDSNPAGKVLR
jgi:hypothetical protein